MNTKTKEALFALLLLVPIVGIVFTRPGDFGFHMARVLLFFGAPCTLYCVLQALKAQRTPERKAATWRAIMFAGFTLAGAAFPYSHYLVLPAMLLVLVAQWNQREQARTT
jgi:hypothetical protein